ncbi:TPA: DUF3467 domain-containing protein [Candidatus Marinimicrobia bacterium]|nr:MAG: Uncharacterized protein XD77_1079 [Marinimicrobia bacterium 46_47]KUK93139.1 MAG: Uncharacterized protein XE04_0343 [Marinimicrobia bacterium 46_43]HAE88064.1 DUF3467 domain-containing protein [Candidatus Neomarinimicrobiota bacterium]HBY18460.1 DUF3467 domain-containing protein [Candidatus Neomarinimicrobiota bacterium]
MNDEKDQKPKEMEINLSEQKASGDYSNLAIVTHSASEFILDFCQVLPGMPKANVASRIILNPQHAKALLKTLEVNIHRYEQAFGEIKEIRHPQNQTINLKSKKNIIN